MRDLAIIARSRSARIVGWALAAILFLVAVAAFGVALWKVPDWMHLTKPQDRYSARLLVISVGGAIVVLTGLVYTARNYRLSRRGQVTDRFTIALERLGSSQLYVRIGGVHALEHVMRDSADHHDDVIEVLTEFIRDRAPRRGRQPDRQGWMHPATGSVPDLPPEPTPDIQAALTALAHRPYRPERQTIDLTGKHLARAWLGRRPPCGQRGGVPPRRGADLIGAQLDGADLTEAWLGCADLTGASLGRADLTRAWLGYADLTRAWLQNADLTGASLGGADLTAARLGDADLTGASLGGADLTRAWLWGANLTRAWLGDADLTGAELVGADLTGSDLAGARLGGADLTDARLDGAIWPPEAAVPGGWERDATGRLKRSSTSRDGQGHGN